MASLEEKVNSRLYLQPWPHIASQVEEFETDLKHRKIRGSTLVGRETAKLLRNVIGTCIKHSTPVETMILVTKDIAHRLTAAQPSELAIENIARRMLHVIRDEARVVGIGRASQPPPHAGTPRVGGSAAHGVAKLLGTTELMHSGTRFVEIKNPVLERVKEVVDEFSNVSDAINDVGTEHIHAGDVLITYGRSRTLLSLLTAAANALKKRGGGTFEVLVAESAPTFWGVDMAKSLLEAGVKATVINDSAVFAVMPRVTKAVVPAHAVMANGGLIAPCGLHMLAIAAKHHSVPLLTVSALYKLSPAFPSDQDSVNDFLSPGAVLPFEDIEDPHRVRVINPAFDYVPPDLVTLIVTDHGAIQPSYVYRLIAENYSREDVGAL